MMNLQIHNRRKQPQLEDKVSGDMKAVMHWESKEGLPQLNIEETTNREGSPPRGIRFQELQLLQDVRIKMNSESKTSKREGTEAAYGFQGHPNLDPLFLFVL